MRPIWWVVIAIASFILPVGLIILITRAILDPPKSWWWTIGTIIILFVIGVLIGVIILILKLRKKKPEELKINPEDAEERAKMMLTYDRDNPDNFIRKDRMIMRVGQAGTERTPILWLKGKGSETKSKIDIVINLNDPSKEIEFLFDKSDEFVKEAIRTIALNPAETEIEEKTVGLDAFGRPSTTIKTKKTTVAEKKEAEIKQKAEEKNAI